MSILAHLGKPYQTGATKTCRRVFRSYFIELLSLFLVRQNDEIKMDIVRDTQNQGDFLKPNMTQNWAKFTFLKAPPHSGNAKKIQSPRSARALNTSTPHVKETANPMEKRRKHTKTDGGGPSFSPKLLNHFTILVPGDLIKKEGCRGKNTSTQNAVTEIVIGRK